MDADELFVHTLRDLQDRSKAVDEYEVLMCVPLLRKLLMDSTPLMDQVNTELRIRVRFPINGVSEFEELIMSYGLTFWSLEDGIDPEFDQGTGMAVPLEATRDQLLARRVMVVNGKEITIRDLIDQLAHIEGGVHLTSPKEDKEKVLKEVAQRVYVGGLPAGVRQVRSIATVVLRGLQPLKDAIEGGSD